jgi:hypothetical protein
MSNIEKRKPFSPVDGKRLLQQNNNRPQKGHRRGKVHGGTNKTSSSKDENSSLASLVDDTGCDFLTNPKPEAITKPMQNEATTNWSSTSKTPKISNVTLPTQQAGRIGKPDHGIAPNPPIQQVNSGLNTRGKPPLPRTQTVPPPNAPRHFVRSFTKREPDPSRNSRDNISSLETIIEGTPEQERESPPSNPPKRKDVEEGFESLLPRQSRGSYLHENKQVKCPPEADEHNNHLEEDASAHTSDMDESSDDDLMNLTISPPGNRTESHLNLKQGEQPCTKGKPPRLSNIQNRLDPADETALSSRFIDQDKRESIAPDHFHTPRAHQTEVKQSTPYPAESFLMPPPKPPEKQYQRTKLETSRQLGKERSFQGANSNRSEYAAPSVHENEAVEIPSTRQPKDPNSRSKSIVESLVAGKIEEERANNTQSSSDTALAKSEDEKIKSEFSTNSRTKNEGTTKASTGDHRIRDHNRPEQTSLKDPGRTPRQTTTQAESVEGNRAVDTQNPNQNNLGRSKRIVHDNRLPAQISSSEIPLCVSCSLSKPIVQVKSATKSGQERKRIDASMQQTEDKEEMRIPTSHQVEKHQKTQRLASENNSQDKELRKNHQRLATDSPYTGSKQFDILKPNENVFNKEMKPNKTEVTQADVANLVRQTITDIPAKEQGNHVPMRRDGAMPDSTVGHTNTKRSTVEPIDKEVWRAMMASPDESNKSTSSFRGLVIETPAQRGGQYDSKSVDGSELTQDTVFLLDYLNLNQSNNLQPTSPKCTTSTSPLTLQSERNRAKLQSITRPGKHHIAAIPQSTAEAKAEKGTDDSEADQCSPPKQRLLPPTTADPTKHDTPAMKRNNMHEKSRSNKSHASTTNPFASVPISTVQFSTPFPTISTRVPVDFINSASNSGRRMLQILQDDVHSEFLSTITKTAPQKGLQPTLWTSEIAGSKVKALGVNAAPVFRLDPGKYFRHPPLPPGWTIAVSRSHNMPFYIHPDFGTTFYSPVPLPSGDGEVQGTTLLYQADTPEYRQPEHACSTSQAASTPIVFGLTKTFESGDTTSSVATHRCEKKFKETPIGALLVTTDDQFSEMFSGEKTNKGLHEALKVLPTEAHLLTGNKLDGPSQNNESASRHEGDSNDSTTTVTIASSHKLQKGGIPTEIEIIHHKNTAEDDKFQMHLDATAEHERKVPSNTIPETTPGMNRYNVVPENKSADKDSKSSASIDSNDASLDWAAGISLDSTASETLYHAEEMIVLHQNRSKATKPSTCSKNTIDQPSSQNFKQSVDSQESENISFSVDDYDHSPSIPQRVIVGIDFDGDDMSRLQCTPLQHEHTATISSRFKPIPASLREQLSDITSRLINNGEKYDAVYEEHSHHSAASRSYASTQTGLSIASRRSLHPLLPLCSLQTLQFVKACKISENKRKKKPKMKQVKRQRTVQTIPISA